MKQVFKLMAGDLAPARQGIADGKDYIELMLHNKAPRCDVMLTKHHIGL